MLSRSINILVLLWSKTQLDRRAHSLHDQHFLDLKKCYGENQHPLFFSKTRPHYRHTHKYTLLRIHPLKLVTHPSVYVICIWSELSAYSFSTFSPPLALKTSVLYITKQAPLPSLLPFCSSFLLPFSIILHFLHFTMTISDHRGAICHRLASFLWGGRFASVSVVVEVSEEDNEGDSVADQSPLHPAGERAASVEGVAGMANGHMELDLNTYNVNTKS